MSATHQSFSSSVRARTPSPSGPSTSPASPLAASTSPSQMARRLSWSKRLSTASAVDQLDDEGGFSHERSSSGGGGATFDVVPLSPSPSHLLPTDDHDDDLDDPLHQGGSYASSSAFPPSAFSSHLGLHPSQASQEGLLLTDHAGTSLHSLSSSSEGEDDDRIRLTAASSSPYNQQALASLHPNDSPSHQTPPRRPSFDTSSPSELASRRSRRSNSASANISPLSLRSSATLRAVRRSIRSVSLRIVNFNASGLNEQTGVRGGPLPGSMRLPEEDDDDEEAAGRRTSSSSRQREGRDATVGDEEIVVDTSQALLIRGELVGKTLGLFGPGSRVRRMCWEVLKYKWTEPFVLFLIMANVVVLTIQGAHPRQRPRESGFFNAWEDYVLFGLFIFFTAEMFARIVVSGLLLDPYTAATLATSSPLRSAPSPPIPTFSFNASTSTSLGLPVADLSTTSKLRGARVKISAAMALSGSKSSTRSRASLKEKEEDDVKRREEEQEAYDSEEDEGDEGMFSIAPLASELGSKLPTYPPQPLRRSPQASSTSNPSGQPYLYPMHSRSANDGHRPTIFPPSTLTFGRELPFQLSLDQQRRLHSLGRPYLRSSWHRIDILAILGFWICFGLAISGHESTADKHIFIFRALSVLRAGRLLLITSGTATILHSLKRAGPLLVNVAFFVLFAMVLFSIIGVQSFQGSFRRSCYSVDPANLTSDAAVSLDKPCGGWYDPSINANRGYFSLKALDGPELAGSKGFICPSASGQTQMCLQADENLQTGQSFDNVLTAAQQVIIIASANTWTPVMYNVIDADGYLGSLFFIVGIIVLYFWLSQLVVAVVVNVFGDIRAETRKSAFGAAPTDPLISALGEDWIVKDSRKRKSFARLRTIYEKTELFWVGLVLGSLVAQGTLSASSSDGHLALLNNLERGFSAAFDVEIIIRILTYLPEWKRFFVDPRNDFDLVLAVMSTVIQTPPILSTEAHGWLTIFPLARWYRVILVIPRMRPLLLAVFGSVAGLLNMTLFLLLMNLLAALLAIQLFQGDIVQDGSTTIIFDQIYNSFLGVYQIFSSENWTDPLYSALAAEFPFQQGVVGGLFLCGWLMFSNFILLQLFIAVIQENFSVAEELKRKEQLDAFIKKTQPKGQNSSWLDRWNPYRLLKPKPKTIKVQNLPANLVLPLKRSIVRDFAKEGAGRSDRVLTDFEKTGEEGIISFVKRTLKINAVGSEQLPMDEFKTTRLDGENASSTQDVDRQFEFLTSTGNATAREEQTDESHEQRNRTADFIAAHPSYDRPLWIFSQENPIRRACQLVVPPADGERIFGRPASPTFSFFFKMGIYLAVIGSVAVAAVATPLYRKGYYATHGLQRGTWFDLTEVALGLIFVVEFLIKVVADGFVFAPNAYLHSIWNVIDFLLLVALLVNTTTSLIFLGGLSRLTRSLKAVRSLRLITLAARLRETFYNTFVAGAGRILDASVLVILYMIPYAVWGVNIFRGRLFTCNDDSVFGKIDCIGSFVNTPVNGIGSGFPVPRTWTNPTNPSVWSFDDFRQSILILFEVVSLEGWIDVMASLMNITSLDQQPSINASQWNAVFMVFYNLFGAIIILTIFVSLIIQNFSTRSGAALLTTEQRQWVDLKKTIYRQAPAKRPKTRPESGFKAWCFDRAAQKHGWWTKGMTVLYVAHIVILSTQSFANTRKGSVAETVRDSIFVGFIGIYTFDLAIRAYGLGWRSFKANGWNLFDLVVIAGSFATTIPVLFGHQSSVLTQLQRLFLCSIALKLIQKLNSLNQLFKTAVASLPVIGNIFGVWLVLFLVWSIMDVEVFGLTKWGQNATSATNFRDFLNSLISLAFMSTGEGWNSFMHDYTVSYPSCTESSNYLESDCGSQGFAFALFISWDVLSQFLLVNMLTGVVVESFSYVFRFPGKASLNREEIRSFKKTWAEFDPNRTGFLHRSQYVAFFAKLSGVLEVRPYPREVSLTNLLKLSEPDDRTDATHPSVVHGVSHSLDLRKLSQSLDRVNIPEVRRRRHLYNRIYHEASISESISFTSMLLLISHYRLINDDDALQLEDLLRRRVKTDFVSNLVDLDCVQGILRTLYWRRKFLAGRDERRRTLQAQTGDMPSIVLDPTPSNLPPLSLDVTSLDVYNSAPNSPSSPSFNNNPRPSLATPDASPSRGHERRVSDISMLSMRSASPDESPRTTMETDRDILASMETSVWGDMMDSDEQA